MTLNMPSSVMFGARPRMFLISPYSTSVMLYRAMMSGVISSVAVDMSVPVQYGVENFKTIDGAEFFFGGTLGMWHEAEHVFFLVADTGDIFERAVRILFVA